MAEAEANVRIVADIGGTNARFACVAPAGNVLLGIEIFPCADFVFLTDAIRAYMEKRRVQRADSICLAVAGPVTSDQIDLPNNHWTFSQRELERSFNTSVKVINDFTAQMLSVDTLAESELQWLGDPRPAGGGVKAVIGPGTGLGVSAMLASGDILPSEAGHVAFAPLNDHQAELLRVLWRRYQRVSVERVLSGPGLSNLYWANCELDGHSRELTAPEVTAGARSGDIQCQRAVDDFFAIMSSFTGDIALMTGATDGVYLSGGILPRLVDFVDAHRFREGFEAKGRLREFNQAIPLAMVSCEHPGLRGCARALDTITG
jgi:glucokinase